MNQPPKKSNEYNLDFLEGKQPPAARLAFGAFPRKIVFFLVILAFITAFILLWHPKPKTNYAAIRNFQDCANAGYKINSDYYPPQCQLPDGKIFLQEFVPEK